MQNGWFAPKKHFFGKIINIIFIYLLTHFIVPKFKMFLQKTQGYEDAPLLDAKWSISQNENFSENLLINLVPIIRLYLNAKN